MYPVSNFAGWPGWGGRASMFRCRSAKGCVPATVRIDRSGKDREILGSSGDFFTQSPSTWQGGGER